ncbi:MAG: hypothetical protein IIA17_06555 [candidate division Zixibacteria bacterium]|nr:hypothetical protein [candidate division Zixibacteria bacterium]
MTEQIQEKGLSKGCTIALIVGGVIFVLVVALIILVIVKKDEFASWAYSKAVISEKSLIAEADLPGIDTIEVNRIADEFLAKVDTARYTQVELMPFVKFVQDGGMDEKVDSAEAVAFVNAMVESFPDLGQYKNSDDSGDMKKQTDSSAASDQSY